MSFTMNVYGVPNTNLQESRSNGKRDITVKAHYYSNTVVLISDRS